MQQPTSPETIDFALGLFLRGFSLEEINFSFYHLDRNAETLIKESISYDQWITERRNNLTILENIYFKYNSSVMNREDLWDMFIAAKGSFDQVEKVIAESKRYRIEEEKTVVAIKKGYFCHCRVYGDDRLLMAHRIVTMLNAA